MTPEKNSRKGVGARPHFWVLTVKISKTAKRSNIKFGMHAPRQSLDMTREKILNRLTGILKSRSLLPW